MWAFHVDNRRTCCVLALLSIFVIIICYYPRSNNGVEQEGANTMEMSEAPDVACKDMRTFGNGDYNKNNQLVGQLPYRVCFDYPVRPMAGDCLVYSFGIANDWSFDDDMAKYGCEVFSFDPTMRMEAHQRPTGVNFYPLGLLKEQYKETLGNLTIEEFTTLGDIMMRLNHTKSIIDVLKLDIEYSEVNLFYDMATMKLMARRVRQILVEWHLWNLDDGTSPLVARRNARKIAGFRSYYVESRVQFNETYIVESLINVRMFPKVANKS